MGEGGAAFIDALEAQREPQWRGNRSHVKPSPKRAVIRLEVLGLLRPHRLSVSVTDLVTHCVREHLPEVVADQLVDRVLDQRRGSRVRDRDPPAEIDDDYPVPDVLERLGRVRKPCPRRFRLRRRVPERVFRSHHSPSSHSRSVGTGQLDFTPATPAEFRKLKAPLHSMQWLGTGRARHLVPMPASLGEAAKVGHVALGRTVPRRRDRTAAGDRPLGRRALEEPV